MQLHGKLLDWTAEDPGLGKFDVVLACDVLYEDFSVEPVAHVVQHLMTPRGGRLILADPEGRTRAHR